MGKAPLIVGNWKMYKTAKEARDFIIELEPFVMKCGARVMLAVPFTAISAAVEAARKSRIAIGAQNMHDAPEGAFTGEISASMLKEAGAQFVILGHSERRQYFNETNEFIQRKIKSALKNGLTPILCVGESEKERESGKTEQVLLKQFLECLNELSSEEAARTILAYEPVWAIGTGKTATPEMADQAHALLRKFYKDKWGEEVAAKCTILYGGSVKPESAEALLEMPNINGALVGGASLKVASFVQIINSSEGNYT